MHRGALSSFCPQKRLWGAENHWYYSTFSFLWIIPTRCRDLHLKQFYLEYIVPAVLIILITHIILAVRWMLIKILSDVINHHGRGNTVVSGGCHPNNNIIRKIDQKSKMGLSHFVTLILWQHRINRQGSSARDFVPVQSFKNEGILYVFPIFETVEPVQKIR